MEPKFSPIRLTVIDFMGVFLPGCIWAVLLATFAALLGQPAISVDIHPVNVAHKMCLQLKDGGLFLNILAGVSVLILGYVAKALSLGVSERIVTAPGHLARLVNRSYVKFSSTDFRFPYDALHRERSYYKSLSAAIKSRIGDDVDDLPGNRLFSACKSMLHAYGDTSSLSEMVQYREAEVRMLSSLLIASIFSVLLAVIGFAGFSGGSLALAWLTVSVLLVILMGSAFAARRRYEVISVYLYALIAMPLMGIPSSGGSDQGVEEVKGSEAVGEVAPNPALHRTPTALSRGRRR